MKAMTSHFKWDCCLNVSEMEHAGAVRNKELQVGFVPVIIWELVLFLNRQHFCWKMELFLLKQEGWNSLKWSARYNSSSNSAASLKTIRKTLHGQKSQSKLLTKDLCSTSQISWKSDLIQLSHFTSQETLMCGCVRLLRVFFFPKPLSILSYALLWVRQMW